MMAWIGRGCVRVAAGAVLSAAVVAGCSDEASVMQGVAGPPTQKVYQVVTKDAVLKRKVRIAQHKAERTEADLLRVRLAVLNTDNDSLWVDIQVVFYDKDGFELEKTNWQPLLLETSQLTYYDTVSLSSRARDYSVLFRSARESEFKQ